MWGTMTVEAEIDINDVFREVDTDELITYLEDDRGVSFLREGMATSDLVEAYYHGDFDIKAFIKSIGINKVESMIAELKL